MTTPETISTPPPIIPVQKQAIYVFNALAVSSLINTFGKQTQQAVQTNPKNTNTEQAVLHLSIVSIIKSPFLPSYSPLYKV